MRLNAVVALIMLCFVFMNIEGAQAQETEPEGNAQMRGAATFIIKQIKELDEASAAAPSDKCTRVEMQASLIGAYDVLRQLNASLPESAALRDEIQVSQARCMNIRIEDPSNFLGPTIRYEGRVVPGWQDKLFLTSEDGRVYLASVIESAEAPAVANRQRP